ncbi:MAG: hypothetical protein JJE03_02205 [Peptostreptococcaceae bacterium]|nr:hypothetical protein [Peptostreptococcaceae bacterium]
MKKIITLMLCIIVSLIIFGCGFGDDEFSNEDEVRFPTEYDAPQEEPNNFKFSEDYLPSEVNVKKVESLGYTLMPVDGEELLYKFHDNINGISEIYFVYRKPLELADSYSSITIILKLFNPFLKNHDDLLNTYYEYGINAADRLKSQDDEVLTSEISSNSINVKTHKSVAKSENGVVLADTWELDDGVFLETYDLFYIKIEGSAIVDGEYDILIDSIYSYLDTYIEDYSKIVYDGK